MTVTGSDSDGLSAQQSFEVTVTEAGSVAITSVEPRVLVEGEMATVHGSGFASSPSGNQVSIGGLPASVSSANATSLTIQVPYSDCLPPRTAELRVTVSGRSSSRSIGVTPLRQEDIDLQQYHYRVNRPGGGCLILPGDAAGAEYLIGVVSTSQLPSSLTPVVMTATAGDLAVAADGPDAASAIAKMASAAAPLSERVDPRARPPAGSPGPLARTLVEPDSVRRDWAFHDRRIAESEAIVEELGPPSLSALAGAGVARAPATGDTLTLRPDGGSCAGSNEVRAVVRLSGDNAIWLEDLANPSGTLLDSELASLDRFYASHVQVIQDEYFGGISDVDGNERILILMTQEVNRQDSDEGFVGGWVWSGDLYPHTQCATSNQAEIFFGRVPDPAGSVGMASTREWTFEYYHSLLAHEVTHIAQFAARAFKRAGRKTFWEMEGGASLAEQLVAYGLFGHGSRQEMGAEEVATAGSWYRDAWLNDLFNFFGWDGGQGRVEGAPEQCTWIGPVDQGNTGPCKGAITAAYGVPSMVLRYALDRWGASYPGGERALMRRLTESPFSGFSSLEEVSNWPIQQVLAEFYIALWLDSRGVPTLGMQSWDLYDIFRHLPTYAQLLPYTSSATDFRGGWYVRGGSSFFLRWTPGGAVAPTSLRVTGPNGSRIPAHMALWAMRIR